MKTAKYSNVDLIKGSGAGTIADPVRKLIGSYFVVEENDLKLFSENGSYTIIDGPHGSKDIEFPISTSDAPSYFEEIDEELFYEDDYYKRAIPFDRDELERINAIGTVAAINVDSFYNFYARTYENVIANPLVPENILPNFYSLLTEKIHGSLIDTFDGPKSLENINTIANNLSASEEFRMGILEAIGSHTRNAGSRYLEYFRVDSFFNVNL